MPPDLSQLAEPYIISLSKGLDALESQAAVVGSRVKGIQ